ALFEVVLGPVVVVAGLAAFAAHVLAALVVRGIRDARRLLLARTVLPEFLVGLLIFDLFRWHGRVLRWVMHGIVAKARGLVCWLPHTRNSGRDPCAQPYSRCCCRCSCSPPVRPTSRTRA